MNTNTGRTLEPVGEAPKSADLEVIETQLGRTPRGVVAVAWRCPCGRPGVITTLPRLDNGTPFPTVYYLTNPRYVAACSSLETGAEGLGEVTVGRERTMARSRAGLLRTERNDSLASGEPEFSRGEVGEGAEAGGVGTDMGQDLRTVSVGYRLRHRAGRRRTRRR